MEYTWDEIIPIKKECISKPRLSMEFFCEFLCGE
jgi:hypothetical protein